MIIDITLSSLLFSILAYLCIGFLVSILFRHKYYRHWLNLWQYVGIILVWPVILVVLIGIWGNRTRL